MAEASCCIAGMGLFLACCSFIFNKLMRDMNVKVNCVLNTTMTI